MPGTFTYTKSTDTVAVTGGTSGSPADIPSLVTADRAGSLELLAAWTPSSGTKALTYQIQPVEILSLLISFIVASKTTETDYIFITGTDAWGGAQTESIDVSAGNGTYVSTKRFRTITNIDCSDNSAGGGTVWADGTVQVTQPQWGVIWSKGSNQFELNAHLEVGDGSTSTYFKSCDETVFIAGSYYIKPKSSATFHLQGSAFGSTTYGPYPVWTFYSILTTSSDSPTVICENALIKFIIAVPQMAYGTCSFTKTIFHHASQSAVGRVDFLSTLSGLTIQDCMVINSPNGVNLSYTSASVDSLIVSNIVYRYGLTNIVGTSSIRNAKYYGTPFTYSFSLLNTASVLDLIDSNLSAITHATCSFVGSSKINIKQSVNINIADRAGTSIESATVIMLDTGSTEVFSVSTDSNGDIAEQIVVYKVLSSGSTSTKSPHSITVSKTGYKTLSIDNITLDDKIIWHLELQPLDEAPAPWEG